MGRQANAWRYGGQGGANGGRSNGQSQNRESEATAQKSSGQARKKKKGHTTSVHPSAIIKKQKT